MIDFQIQNITPRHMGQLVKCLNKVASEGLTLPENARIGFNAKSGNVYIWSEDWAGTVYAPRNSGDAQWLHTCPECGFEGDFDTLADVEKYNDAHDGMCEACETEQLARAA